MSSSIQEPDTTLRLLATISLVLLAGPATGAEVPNPKPGSAAAVPAAAVAEPKPLHPALEEVLAFVTDKKGLDRVRAKGVVARLRPIIAIKQTGKDEYGMTFQGKAAQGPIASAEVVFEGGPSFRDANFKLRPEAGQDLGRILWARVEKKLGKPSYFCRDRKKNPVDVHWFVENTWDISIDLEKDESGEISFGVGEYREPEEDPEGE
jgi:hypothetical protein